MADLENSAIGFAIGFVCAVGILVLGVAMAQGQVAATQAAEPVTATILESDVDVRIGDDGEENYYAEVTYRYRVDGRTYTSDVLYPTGVTKTFATRGDAESFVSKYPPGSERTAHYDPTHPGEAFLVKKLSYGPLAMIGVGLLGAGISGRELLGRVRDSV